MADPVEDTDARQMRLADEVRLAVIDAVKPIVLQGLNQRGDAAPLIGGCLVAMVQLAQATIGNSDEHDAAIRASIMQLAGWAVDMAREAEGRGPLHNA